MGTDARHNDELANLGLTVIALTAGLGGLLWTAGGLAALLSSTQQPAAGLLSGLEVLRDPLRPGVGLHSPALNPFVYWACFILLSGAIGAAGVGVWRLCHSTTTQNPKVDHDRLPGTATGTDLRGTTTGKALLSRSATLRPSLTRPTASEVGYLLGSSHGREVWASVEDSLLLLGPPRSGKGLHIVVNAILDAPGAVVTTSTRPDNLTVTLRQRERYGPVAVFDPQQLAPGVGAGLRWSPVRGCEDPLTAMIRATGLASSTDFASVSGGDFWQGKTIAAIQALLHAAALDERNAATLYRWALNPVAAGDAVAILASNPHAATGWADSLGSMLDSDPKTRDSIWQGVSLAFGALADPRVLSAVSPGPHEHFEPERFLRENGTLYLLATGAGAGAAASLVAAFIEDIVETARKLAAASPGARLDPPLLMALDEIGNLAPLPSLPVLMAEGGGTGITTMPVLQSLAQARDKWGQDAADAIWDAAIVKIILGGAANSRDLSDLSTLIGERDETTHSTTRDAQGGHSTQASQRRLPILSPDRIRTLPFGRAVVLLRSAPPIITRLRPWPSRPDAATLRGDRATVEADIQHNFGHLT